MKRCATCGWWFESSDARRKFCDGECRKEAQRISWKRSKERKKDASPKKKAILKIRPDKLPKPQRAATKEFKGMSKDDAKLKKLWEEKERRKDFEET